MQFVNLLQGDLQLVFDALYDLGVIEPVLRMDWRSRLTEIEKGSQRLKTAVGIANDCGQDRARLNNELKKLDRGTLEILALAVASEYAGFHARIEDLH